MEILTQNEKSLENEYRKLLENNRNEEKKFIEQK